MTALTGYPELTPYRVGRGGNEVYLGELRRAPRGVVDYQRHLTTSSKKKKKKRSGHAG
jgi:hypothetical protein